MMKRVLVGCVVCAVVWLCAGAAPAQGPHNPVEEVDPVWVAVSNAVYTLVTNASISAAKSYTDVLRAEVATATNDLSADRDTLLAWKASMDGVVGTLQGDGAGNYSALAWPAGLVEGDGTTADPLAWTPPNGVLQGDGISAITAWSPGAGYLLSDGTGAFTAGYDLDQVNYLKIGTDMNANENSITNIAPTSLVFSDGTTISSSNYQDKAVSTISFAGDSFTTNRIWAPMLSYSNTVNFAIYDCDGGTSIVNVITRARDAARDTYTVRMSGLVVSPSATSNTTFFSTPPNTYYGLEITNIISSASNWTVNLIGRQAR